MYTKKLLRILLDSAHNNETVIYACVTDWEGTGGEVGIDSSVSL